MANRITVSYAVPDARADVKARRFRDLGFKSVKSVAIQDAYTIDKRFGKKDLEKIARMLANPILEQSSVNKVHPPKRFSWLIEIGYLPGVTDNVGTTVRETIEDLLKLGFKSGEAVYTSKLYFIDGRLARTHVEAISNSLHNPLIERARILSFAECKKGGLPVIVPKVSLKPTTSVLTVDLNIPDDELAKLGKEGVKGADGTRRGPLALELDYLYAIRDYFNKQKRNLTDVELESIAQTWSEHCKHTIFANPIDEVEEGLYRGYIKKATHVIRKQKGKKDFCASVFTDNAGAIIFDDEYLISHKVETHNSPSALDPFGGAITGIVGVNRDAMGFGMGAKPVANVYGFCLGNPDDTRPLYRDAALTERMLAPVRIMEGVVHGVNAGGNTSGIPTAQGFVYFDDRYRGKPLVFAGTVGLIPRKVRGKDSTKKRARPGDYIVMAGGRVGLDGIHGATFSSEALSSGSPATAVQIGDPITQKKMSDAIVKEARDTGLYSSITDNGAGGLSCSVAEMARESGGAEVNLEKVPLKYQGLAPWQIWISESQERMTLAVPPAKWKAFEKLVRKRGVEATVIGRFTDSGRCIVKHGSKKVMDVELDFLHDGLPERHLASEKSHYEHYDPPTRDTKELAQDFTNMLARLNIGSYEFISKQYDHEVQASSALKPLQGRGRVNGEVAVFRPVLGSKKGVVLASALNPAFTELDSYRMAAASIDSAIRAAVAAGADFDYLAILDNFCWASSNDPERLGELKDAVRACYDYAVAYGTPFISGKDSMFNDFKGFNAEGDRITISIPPTLLISAISVIPDARKAVSIDFKCANDIIYLVGQTRDELGGSEYAAYRSEEEGQEYLGSDVPDVDARENKKLYRTFHACAKQGVIASAISVGRGGLGAALAKSAIAAGLGVEVSLKPLKDASSDEYALFSESQGRILTSVSPKNAKTLEKAFRGLPLAKLGKVSAKATMVMRGKNGKPITSVPLARAAVAYRSRLKNF